MMVSQHESLKSYEAEMPTNNQNPASPEVSNFYSGGTVKSSITPKLDATLLPGFGDYA